MHEGLSVTRGRRIGNPAKKPKPNSVATHNGTQSDKKEKPIPKEHAPPKDSTAVKRKPMICESDSDEGGEPVRKPTTIKTEAVATNPGSAQKAPAAGVSSQAKQTPQEVKQEKKDSAAKAKPEVKKEVTKEAKPEVKKEVKLEAKKDAKKDLKTEIKSEIKNNVKPEVKNEVKGKPKKEVEVAVKQEVKEEEEEEEEMDDDSVSEEDDDEDYDSPEPPPNKKKGGKVESAKKPGVKRGRAKEESEEEEEELKTPKAKKPATSKSTKSTKSKGVVSKQTPATKQSSAKVKKEKEVKEVWKWWEEAPHPEGVKWLTLEHKGPYFPPLYESLPDEVHFYYDGKPMKLSLDAEEAATFFAKMLDHDYTKRDIFCQNFFNDWKKEMTSQEARVITDFTKCDFAEMHKHFKDLSEARKAKSKEEKKALKAENEKIQEEYGWCIIDGHKEKIGNFKIEPPGLFRGRGDHPKQGKIKKRVQPEEIIINIGKGAQVPVPPAGHKWKSVQHDNKVTWLVSWTESIQGAIKYVMLNPTSRLKGEKDWCKYETARKLKDCIETIREQYIEDWKSKEMKVRQRAVAVYFIDKLALRAGNEKDADESADTVGCCSLRVEHIKLHEELEGKEFVVEFDFLGKDSIRYYNKIPVEKQVFKNLSLFMKGKEPGDDLFDRLTTTTLNKHLSELMPGLTAKVFRTYNASITLQAQLDKLTNADDPAPSKLLAYNRANRAVAILCNHQRAAPKNFTQQMSNLQAKLNAKDDTIAEVKKDIKDLQKEAKATKDSKILKQLESKQKRLAQLEDQRQKLEVQATDKEENKEIALGTSKLNYLDPRITVSWCKKWEIPIEKVYNRTQRDKFAWAIDMADETFVF
eukprot:Em0018g1093a